MPTVHREIDRIFAEVRQFQLLKLKNDTRGRAAFTRRKMHICPGIERRHHGVAIDVDEGNLNSLPSFFETLKPHFDRQRAERVSHRRAVRIDAVKRAEHIQFAARIRGGGVTKGEDFDFQARKSYLSPGPLRLFSIVTRLIMSGRIAS